MALDGDGVAPAGGGVAAAAGDWARIGLLQVDGAAPGAPGRAWVEAAARPSLPFLRPGRLPAPLSAQVGFGYHWWPYADADHDAYCRDLSYRTFGSIVERVAR